MREIPSKPLYFILISLLSLKRCVFGVFWSSSSASWGLRIHRGGDAALGSMDCGTMQWMYNVGTCGQTLGHTPKHWEHCSAEYCKDCIAFNVMQCNPWSADTKHCTHIYTYFKKLNKYTHTLHNAKLFGVVGELKLDCTWSPVHCSVQAKAKGTVGLSLVHKCTPVVAYFSLQCSGQLGKPKGQLSWVDYKYTIVVLQLVPPS